MATLLKRPGSPFWIAAFDVSMPDGAIRRLKKSTKKTKCAEAMNEAIRMEELERAAGTSTGVQASKADAILSEAAAASRLMKRTDVRLMRRWLLQAMK